MNKKVYLLVLVAALLLSPLSFFTPSNKFSLAASSFQRVDFTSAKVTGDYLNVRQGPSTNYPVVCVLKRGQVVKIFGKIDGWYAVYEPAKRCVGVSASKYLKPIYSTTATPRPTAPVPTIGTPIPQATSITTPRPTTMPTGTPQSVPGITSEEQQLLDLINRERANAGIGPLKFDMTLEKVSRLKAKDLVDNNYFAHQSPTYGSPFDMMRQFGVSFKTAGENLAGNQTLEGAVKAWMNSEGHRKNILNGNFNYTGIGIVKSSTYGKVLVQQFIGK